MPLGILLKNENKGSEMVEIMTNLQHYVPLVEYSEDHFIPSLGEAVQVPKASFHRVLVGGDQLTAARARGAKMAKVNADSPISRLEGLVPVAADWHTKLNFLGVGLHLINILNFSSRYIAIASKINGPYVAALCHCKVSVVIQ